MKQQKHWFLIMLTLIMFNASASEPIRFAFLTDLHISTINRTASKALMAVVNDVNQCKPDFVLIGGDIADKGDSLSLCEARSILNKLNAPYYLVPGNHDFRWKEGCSDLLFNKVFGNHRYLFTYNNVIFAGFATVPELISGNAIVRPDDLHWLIQSLEKAGKEKSVILITHYPWLTGDIDNWQILTDSLKGFKIKAVLNGHYHRNTLLNYKGIPGIVNRSTLPDRNQETGYSLFSLSDTLSVSERRIGKEEIKWLELPPTDE